MDGWFVIYVVVGKEVAICEQIELIMKEDFNELKTMVPRRVLYEYHKGEWLMVTKTLFPGYILIKTDEQTVRSLYENTKYCNNIRRFLKTGTYFQKIPYREMEPFLFMMDENGIINAQRVYKKENKFFLTNIKEDYSIEIQKVNLRKRRAKIQIYFDSCYYNVDIGIEKGC